MVFPASLGRSLRLMPQTISHTPKRGLPRPRRPAVYLPIRPRLRRYHEASAPSTGPESSLLPSLSVIAESLFGHEWKTDLENSSSAVTYRRKPEDKPFVSHRAWLRDSCTCDRCVDPSSGQKRFATVDVPLSLRIGKFSFADGYLEVHWEGDFFTHDTHVSRYHHSLWTQDATTIEKESRAPARLWDRDVLTAESPFYSHDSFMKSQAGYRATVETLSRLGIMFLSNVPKNEDSVKEIAAKLGVIQDTFYGTTWDVRAKPNAENVAYTSSSLCLHQDLLYMNNVPRIQILHCLENSCSGGESLFSDGLYASHLFRARHLHESKILLDRKVRYQYMKGKHSYFRSRRVLGPHGLWWAPPFQSPVQRDYLDIEGMVRYQRWLKAARMLRDVFEGEGQVYEYRMRPGDCVVFDNRRILHGRRNFDSVTGERWLKGTYVENDSYNSVLRSLGILEQRDLGYDPLTRHDKSNRDEEGD
ncbi:Clavaminate synthase-like protein [Nemania sp. FL0916]|nr:Clavaminate synthase-like protein [Nemania sp. FL0916]